MEIGSSGGIPPQNPDRKTGGAGAPKKKGEAESAQDSFSGPSTGELKKKLESMDVTNDEKIEEIKSALNKNAYTTEERIQGLVDKLISNL